MSTGGYSYPVAISKLGPDEGSREPQNVRAIKWLLAQDGGPVVVVTPRKEFEGASLKKLVAHPRVHHHSWKGFSMGSLHGTRALVAWPDRKHLNDLWDAGADALVVIEWNEQETAEWIEDSNATLLVPGAEIAAEPTEPDASAEPLPNGIDGILEHIASLAAGYDSGLKWNEEDKLRADMMNRPDRWRDVTVEQVRSKCRALGMRPNDVDTVAGFLQKRKEGKRFNVRSSYRTFQFN
ncbi:MAG: hypothetical protein Q4C81_04765 [Kocuria sp.]|nr:hypothetical protein [Kocuria sp.]